MPQSQKRPYVHYAQQPPKATTATKLWVILTPLEARGDVSAFLSRAMHAVEKKSAHVSVPSHLDALVLLSLRPIFAYQCDGFRPSWSNCFGHIICIYRDDADLSLKKKRVERIGP